MMGKQKKQESLFSYKVNLDERIPSSHPLRKAEASLFTLDIPQKSP